MHSRNIVKWLMHVMSAVAGLLVSVQDEPVNVSLNSV